MVLHGIAGLSLPFSPAFTSPTLCSHGLSAQLSVHFTKTRAVLQLLARLLSLVQWSGGCNYLVSRAPWPGHIHTHLCCHVRFCRVEPVARRGQWLGRTTAFFLPCLHGFPLGHPVALPSEARCWIRWTFLGLIQQGCSPRFILANRIRTRGNVSHCF